jgi:hypothetical protein
MPDSQVLDLFRSLDIADSGVVEFTELQAFIEGPQWIANLSAFDPAPVGPAGLEYFHAGANRQPLDELTELVRSGILSSRRLSSELAAQFKSESLSKHDVQGNLRSLELQALSDATIAAVFHVLSRQALCLRSAVLRYRRLSAHCWCVQRL